MLNLLIPVAGLALSWMALTKDEARPQQIATRPSYVERRYVQNQLVTAFLPQARGTVFQRLQDCSLERIMLPGGGQTCVFRLVQGYPGSANAAQAVAQAQGKGYTVLASIGLSHPELSGEDCFLIIAGPDFAQFATSPSSQFAVLCESGRRVQHARRNTAPVNPSASSAAGVTPAQKPIVELDPSLPEEIRADVLESLASKEIEPAALLSMATSVLRPAGYELSAVALEKKAKTQETFLRLQKAKRGEIVAEAVPAIVLPKVEIQEASKAPKAIAAKPGKKTEVAHTSTGLNGASGILENKPATAVEKRTES